VFSSQFTSYWMHDNLRINADVWYKDMPDNYWGIGYEKAAGVPKSDTTTAYTRRWWWINPRIMYQLFPSFYLGLSIDYNFSNMPCLFVFLAQQIFYTGSEYL